MANEEEFNSVENEQNMSMDEKEKDLQSEGSFNQENREDGSPYKTEDGGSGYRYGSDFTYEPARNVTRNHSHRALVVAVALLTTLVTLLIATVIFTTLFALYGRNDRYPVNSNTEQGTTAQDTTHKSSVPVVVRSENDSGSVVKADPIEESKIDLATGSAGDRAYATITEAVSVVKDSVVEIVVTTTSTSYFGVPTVQSGAGSGVIITDDGHIVTNNHVIEGAKTISVTLTDGSTYEAALVGTSEADDLAVIKIDPGTKKLTVADLGCSSNLLVGESVIAIGNPLGSLGGTVTNGIISALERRVSIDGHVLTLLQTNAAISPGNSGGGLFNMAGQLIGIVNAKSSSVDVEGIGFAIPIDTAYVIIKDLMDYGYVRGQVDHGLTIHDITNKQVARYYFNSNETGVYCTESKYADVPVEYGDKIVSVNGVEVSSVSAFEQILKRYAVGDKVTLVVVRSGEQVSVEITLHEYVPDYITAGN